MVKVVLQVIVEHGDDTHQVDKQEHTAQETMMEENSGYNITSDVGYSFHFVIFISVHSNIGHFLSGRNLNQFYQSGQLLSITIFYNNKK